MTTYVQNYRLDENVFIETNIQSNEYDAVVLLLYPEELKVKLPKHVESFVNSAAKLDKHVTKEATVWNCDYVSGGRLVLSPTGKITPYHDVRVVGDAAKKGVLRALDAGAKKPLVVVLNVVEYPDGQLVAILGALEALYVPLQLRERENPKNYIRIGFHAQEQLSPCFQKIVRNAIALERSRIVARDIAGGDPERMAPGKIVEYVKHAFAGYSNISINVIENEEEIAKDYPLLAAVSRAANRVDRHKARIVEIVYTPTTSTRVSETLMLVGKGVTYDTGGADIKISGKMAGMSRDKCGAAAVAGFLRACSILKPTHLKVIGVLCLCRNSVGEDSYVADELLVSRSGKSVRVTNTDAEGRFAMADSVFKMAELADNELNPHIYTIATLTGHARACYGGYSAAMDNHSARATNHSNRLQFSGGRVGEGIEVSIVRHEDMAVNVGKCKGDDLLQVDMDTTCRHHQLAAGFLIKVGGLEERNVKYTHLDIAGAAGAPPKEPTAVPILTLCHVHKILLQ
ncbi:putative aminopeptidase W07G4.4 [Ostrinia nubilalis]|uniref:putative aminopeptidase W07G4.4 n=1 Tax=Ostrinia nubilalis TaxID=29057 RepID=UPI00308249AF